MAESVPAGEKVSAAGRLKRAFVFSAAIAIAAAAWTPAARAGIDDLRTPEYDLIFGTAQKARATASPDVPAALEAPVDPHAYVMVPGDLVLLEVGGETDRSWRLAVSAEGELLVPGGTPVRASGKTLEVVIGLVRDGLVHRFPGQPVNLHLMQLGAFRVPVTGQVLNPGVVVLHAYDRLSAAIAASGGPVPGASLRRIAVTLADGSRRECDLVRFAVEGKLDENPTMAPGSIVQVPPARDYVRVTGAVRGLPGPDRAFVPNAGSRIPENPNLLLEWKDGDTAALALTRAGGLSEDASDAILLARGSARRLIHGADADTIVLEPGDLLEAAMRERWVYVNGAVRFPGPYPYLPSLAAADYVRLAGGPTEIGRGYGWNMRLPGNDKKVGIENEAYAPPGATISVPERWTYGASTLLAPITGIAALVISVIALRH